MGPRRTNGLHHPRENDAAFRDDCRQHYVFFFSSRRRHTRCLSDWSSDVCSSDLDRGPVAHRGVHCGGRGQRYRRGLARADRRVADRRAGRADTRDLRDHVPGRSDHRRRGARRDRARADQLPVRPGHDPLRRHLQRRQHVQHGQDPGARQHPDHRPRLLRRERLPLHHLRADRDNPDRPVRYPVGAAGARGRRAPGRGRHGRHQGAVDEVPQRHPGRPDRRDRRGIPDGRLGRLLHLEHQLGLRVHRARRHDLRALDAARLGGGGAAVRVQLPAADRAVRPAGAGLFVHPADGAVRGDDHRRGRAGGAGAAAGRRRKAVYQGMTVTADPYQAARASAARLAELTGQPRHDVAVVLGSGWAPAADALGTVDAEVPLAELGGFPPPTVGGHAPAVRSVRAGPVRALVFLGRVHLYEGHDVATVVHGVRTAVAAGCQVVVLTNAAGGIREGYQVGQPVLIRDHLNLTGRSPLGGLPPPDGYPPRFTDLTDLYSARLRALAAGAALRDAGRDPGAPHARRRPGRHVHRARGHRRAPSGRGGARHLAGEQPGGRAGPARARPRGGGRRRQGGGGPEGVAAGRAAARDRAVIGGDLRAQAEHWIAGDPDERDRAELRGLLDDGGEAAAAELADRFGARLEFGTAGLRGAIGAGPNRMNRAVVRAATAALARWLAEHGGPDAAQAGVVIGCDARHRSGEFADEAARVLAGAGIRAHLLQPQQPTPLLAFSVGHLRAAAGIMITASHNPPADNGYKLYLNDGAQIIPPVDKQIGAAIAALGDLSEVPVAPADSPLIGRLGDEVARAYLDAIVAAVPGPPAPGGAPAPAPGGAPPGLRVVYTPLHGVAAGLAVRAFERAG